MSPQMNEFLSQPAPKRPPNINMGPFGPAIDELSPVRIRRLDYGNTGETREFYNKNDVDELLRAKREHIGALKTIIDGDTIALQSQQRQLTALRNRVEDDTESLNKVVARNGELEQENQKLLCEVAAINYDQDELRTFTAFMQETFLPALTREERENVYLSGESSLETAREYLDRYIRPVEPKVFPFDEPAAPIAPKPVAFIDSTPDRITVVTATFKDGVVNIDEVNELTPGADGNYDFTGSLAWLNEHYDEKGRPL